MTGIYIDLFSMSVYGGILILVVLFVRMLLKNKLPKQTFPVLWCVALLRLLLPFSVPSSLSVYSLVQRQTAALQERETDGGADFMTALASAFYMEGTDLGETYGYFVNNNGSYSDGKDGAGIGSGSKPTEDRLINGLRELSLFQRAAFGGTVVCAAIFLMLYLNCLRMFGTALPLENRFAEQWMSGNRLLRRVKVRQSDRISSPLTYGIFRPVILLPKQMEREGGQKLEYILQHEMVHIRRFDGAWKFILAAALCLHWFNPLVWVMYVFMNRDLELACDEEVLRTFGAEARKDYALTLLGMEERRYSPVSLYSGFGKNAVEERVGEIMKYKKKTKAAIGMGAALILAVTCMFATSAKAGEGDNTFGGDAKVQNTGTDNNSEGNTLIPDAGNAGTASEPPAGAKTPESAENPGTAGIIESAAEGRTDSLAATLTVMAFAMECQRGDESAVSSRLSESCQWDAYVMGMLTEWRLEELSVRLHPEGDAAMASIPVRTTESDDSQDYLTIELAKEREEWKITFIGLEK